MTDDVIESKLTTLVSIVLENTSNDLKVSFCDTPKVLHSTQQNYKLLLMSSDMSSSGSYDHHHHHRGLRHLMSSLKKGLTYPQTYPYDTWRDLSNYLLAYMSMSMLLSLGMTSVITSSDGVVIVVIEVCSNPNMTLKKKRSNIPPNTFL